MTVVQPAVVETVQPQVAVPVPAPAPASPAVQELTPEQDGSPVMFPGYGLYYSNGRYYHQKQK